MFLEKIVFPDDKISTLNDIAEQKQVLAYGPVETPPTPYQRTISKALHAKGVMVWGSVTKMGKLPLIFVPQGAKVNA